MRPPPDDSRRRFLQRVPALVVAPALAGSLAAQADDPPDSKPRDRLTPDDSLKRLIEGNKNFIQGKLKSPRQEPEDYKRLADGQSPIAAIVGCADSRVPPEVLFDQGLGDLFTIRVAGNVVRGAGSMVTGSIEYAVAELKLPLVLILGHSRCGAVKAAIKYPDSDDLPYSLGELVDSIQPAVADARREKADDLLEAAIRANVRRGVRRLARQNLVVIEAVKAGRLKVIGATYKLEDGKVVLLDG